MELLISAEPALADASYRLIDLVDRVLKRHPGKPKTTLEAILSCRFFRMSDRGLGIFTKREPRSRTRPIFRDS